MPGKGGKKYVPKIVCVCACERERQRETGREREREREEGGDGEKERVGEGKREVRGGKMKFHTNIIRSCTHLNAYCAHDT